MKLIALDLDGTTLDSNKEISEENLRAILKAQREGHIIMVLSGRAMNRIKPVLKKYGLKCHIGANNGASLYVNDELIHRTVFKPEQFRRIYLELEKEGIPYNITTNKGVFAPRDWGERLEKVLSSGLVPQENYENRHFGIFTVLPTVHGHKLFDNIDDIIEEDSSVQKFMVLTLDPIQKKRLEETLGLIDEIHVASSSINIDMMHQDANKGNALKIMAEHFNIALKDTIAIGDEGNDITMFKVAGLAVAMSNATDEVKSHSNVVTLSNDEDGVAYAINNYVLNT
ncbi:Cof-type HAD-IIB family hydrolase [Ornithinibacillus sp. FSL M8-0202]|uniref:Cof-type HAD-IIB family hydrolase n=1 Tax=Ornithinibacillus sp. FSL M8-0202 TaxID=2921616 RepID=UPI0030D4A0B1